MLKTLGEKKNSVKIAICNSVYYVKIAILNSVFMAKKFCVKSLLEIAFSGKTVLCKKRCS